MIEKQIERLAEAIEEQNEIVMGILKGVAIGTMIIIGAFAILFAWQPVSDFFYYDVLGNEKTFPVAVGIPMTQEQIEQEYRRNYYAKALGLEKPYPSDSELESMYQLSISHAISAGENQGIRAKAVVDGNNFYWLIQHNNGTFKKFLGSYDELLENYELEAVILL